MQDMEIINIGNTHIKIQYYLYSLIKAVELVTVTIKLLL